MRCQVKKSRWRVQGKFWRLSLVVSQGMPHDIEVPSGGGFQAVSLTGILFVWPYPRA